MADEKESKGLPRPTEKSIEAFAKTMEARWGEFWKETRHRKDLRFRKAKVDFGPSGIPEAYKTFTTEVRTPDLQYNAQQAQALVLSNAPQPVIRVSKAGLEAKATLAERFCRAALSRVNESKTVCAGVTGAQVCSGFGMYCSYPRPGAWPEYPTQADAETPEDYDKRTEEWKKAQSFMEVFVLRSVPVDTVAFKEDDRGISRLVEIKKVDGQELLERFSNALHEAASSGLAIDAYEEGRDVEVIEYWDRQWRALYTKNPKGKEGHLLDVWEHKFGLVPYFLAEAYTTGELEPLEKYIPLLAPMYAEAEENNRLHTMRTCVAHFTAFPQYYIYIKETQNYMIDETTGQPKVFTMKPGEIPQIPPGCEIRSVNLISGFDLQAALKDSDMRMKEFALPPIATGNAPSGDSAGYETAMLRRFLISLLNPLVQGRAKALAPMYRFWMYSIKYIVSEKVYVHEEAADEAGQKGQRGEPIGLGPDDIADWDVGVYISPDPQLDAVALEQHGWATTQGGGCSMERYLTDYVRLAAPEEELEKIDADRIYKVLEPAEIEKTRIWITSYGMTERILAGEDADAVVNDMQRTVSGMGKGSGGQPRVPGVRMPVAPPIGESPTFTPPYAEGGGLGPGGGI